MNGDCLNCKLGGFFFLVFLLFFSSGSGECLHQSSEFIAREKDQARLGWVGVRQAGGDQEAKSLIVFLCKIHKTDFLQQLNTVLDGW